MRDDDRPVAVDFTTLHVVLSLIGILAGIVVVLGMLGARRLPGWTLLFLLTTILTSVTGLLFLFRACCHRTCWH